MTSSEQARADAMADAETLRRIAQELRHGTIPERVAAAFGLHARTAIHHGWRAQSAQESRKAAHAAFCAVPALRGEDGK